MQATVMANPKDEGQPKNDDLHGREMINEGELSGPNYRTNSKLNEDRLEKIYFKKQPLSHIILLVTQILQSSHYV